MHARFAGESIRVVATDSGLGGLAVAADLVEQLKTNGAFRKAHVVFFNCRPAETVGFDTMTTPQRRHRVFSRALDAMTREFEPDAFLIACNTLSVLVDQTDFARKPHGPVIDLVKIGVDLILRHLERHSTDRILMFAAPTTVQSGVHRRLIMAQGWPADQVIYRNCGGLPTLIEKGSHSDAVRERINRDVGDAVAKAPGRRARVGALLCTHFGFALTLFKEAFRRHGVAVEPVLDPTPQMAPFFLEGSPHGRYGRTDVTVEVVSQTIITPDVQASIGGTISLRSPQTADALHRYAYRPGLFATD